jgi:hypothetical protein
MPGVPGIIGIGRARVHAAVVQIGSAVDSVAIPVVSVRTTQQRPIKILAAKGHSNAVAFEHGEVDQVIGLRERDRDVVLDDRFGEVSVRDAPVKWNG